MSYYLKKVKKTTLDGYNFGDDKDMVTILDTNVLSYMLNKDANQQINDYILEHQNIANKLKLKSHLAISSVSIFECLQGNNPEEYEKLFEDFICLETSSDIQYMAVKMKMFLKKRGITLNNIPDLYIGATAMYTAGIILTANESDYPSAMFKEIHSFYIKYKAKGRTKGITLYIIRPDYIKLKETFFGLK